MRAEPPPDDDVVVVRGGPIAADKVVEHARRQQALFTYRGEPMAAMSAERVVPGRSVDRILRERCDVQHQDELGMPYALLVRGACPSRIVPGAIVITADEEDPVYVCVHALTQHGDVTVGHLELLPGDPLDDADARQRSHPLSARRSSRSGRAGSGCTPTRSSISMARLGQFSTAELWTGRVAGAGGG